MSVQVQIPTFLAPDESVRWIGSFRILGIYELVDRFANQYQLEHEVAFASLLAGFAHSLGGAVELDSPLGLVRPPFSLLLATPETDAIWTRVPIRFVTDDFENTMRAFASVKLPADQGSDAMTETSSDDSEATRTRGIPQAVETAKMVYAKRVSERISHSSLVAPFPRVPFDGHSLITTPSTGLERAFRQLSPGERHRLEEALTASAPLPPRSGEEPGAAPRFYWAVDRHEARRFFERNSWFSRVPFLLLESSAPGAVILDPDGGVSGEIQRRCLDLFVARHQAMGRPRTHSTRSRAFRAWQEFVTVAQRWEAQFDRPSPVRPARVAKSALQFALLFTVLDGKSEPDEATVFMGLELAKRLHIRHLKTLAKFLPVAPSHVPDTEGLSDRETKIYFRICERPGISPSALNRSFNKMRKEERDRALTALAGRGLIEWRDGGLHQKMDYRNDHEEKTSQPSSCVSSNPELEFNV